MADPRFLRRRGLATATAALVLLLAPSLARAVETSVDCSGLKLEKANCVPGGPNHVFVFGGSCTFNVSEAGGAFQKSYASHHPFPVEVKAEWHAETRTLTEKLRTLGGFEWGGKVIGGRVETEYVCGSDPLLTSTDCEVNHHSNDTGLPALSVPAQQFRPITAGRTTPAEAAALSTKPSCPVAPPPPAPNPSPKLPALRSAPDSTSPAQRAPGGAARALPPRQAFDAPSLDDRRVDWCLHWGADCGEAAATAFCQRMGYEEASGWTVAEDVGPTWVLGDDKACTDPGCDGFEEIRCTR